MVFYSNYYLLSTKSDILQLFKLFNKLLLLLYIAIHVYLSLKYTYKTEPRGIENRCKYYYMYIQLFSNAQTIALVIDAMQISVYIRKCLICLPITLTNSHTISNV